MKQALCCSNTQRRSSTQWESHVMNIFNCIVHLMFEQSVRATAKLVRRGRPTVIRNYGKWQKFTKTEGLILVPWIVRNCHSYRWIELRAVLNLHLLASRIEKITLFWCMNVIGLMRLRHFIFFSIWSQTNDNIILTRTVSKNKTIEWNIIICHQNAHIQVEWSLIESNYAVWKWNSNSVIQSLGKFIAWKRHRDWIERDGLSS